MKLTIYLLATIAALTVSSLANAAQTVYGPLHIVGVFARDEPPNLAGGRGFYIQVDVQIPMTSCSTSGNTIYLIVPKKLSGGSTDNLVYRDLYNTAALAFALQKGIYIWVDSCAAGSPEVWGIDMLV